MRKFVNLVSIYKTRRNTNKLNLLLTISITNYSWIKHFLFCKSLVWRWRSPKTSSYMILFNCSYILLQQTKILDTHMRIIKIGIWNGMKKWNIFKTYLWYSTIKVFRRNVSNIPEFIRHYQIKTLSNFVHGFITTKMYASHFKSSKLQF